jgi:hypothetical protein
MRDDMHRVIITRARFFPPKCAPRKGRAKPLEELPAKRGMRRDHAEKWAQKQLSDHLSPLRRYLEKQVGRPWNKVYSEIAQKFGVKGPIHYHLRRHVFEFVAVKPRRQTFSYRGKTYVRLWGQALYVDERDGILKRTDRLRENRAALAQNKEERVKKRSRRKKVKRRR